ncbi:MAG: hypothetical protein IJU01_05050 [Lachnospiraceae bacterium]|nr:hypothetical protein [Lachnospiraceae bacterium]MBR6271688.1 hypothetical protein [Lachnospiraceae bacterium]
MKTKKIIALLAAAVILIVGLRAVTYGYNYYKAENVEIYKDSDGSITYRRVDDGGVSDIIIEEDIEKTNAMNNVAAVVFDFRGYDTLGESFILLTAIAGSFVILARNKKSKKEETADEV